MKFVIINGRTPSSHLVLILYASPFEFFLCRNNILGPAGHFINAQYWITLIVRKGHTAAAWRSLDVLFLKLYLHKVPYLRPSFTGRCSVEMIERTEQVLLRSFPQCVLRKFLYPQNKGISFWNFVANSGLGNFTTARWLSPILLT